MPELRELCDKIEKKANEARVATTKRHWAELSRAGFIYNITTILPLLEELYSLFQIARTQAEKQEQKDLPELSAHTTELAKLITLLKRNCTMEESRLEKMKKQGIESIADDISSPDLYSDLEQKTLGNLLKSAYIVDKIRIIERKKEPLLNTKAVQKNILELLEKRENEIEELRGKYDQIRKNSFFGMLQKESSIELEHDLNALARKIEAKTLGMKKTFTGAKTTFEIFQRQMAELESEINEVEEIQGQETGKTFELITMLKKERDYAKKVLMEIEQETLQLRSAYSKELLSLQEEKMHYKNTIEQKYTSEISNLKKELKDRAELIKSLQDSVVEKEKRVGELFAENERLLLVGKTVQRHHKVKEHFAKMEKQAEKQDNEENEKKP